MGKQTAVVTVPDQVTVGQVFPIHVEGVDPDYYLNLFIEMANGINAYILAYAAVPDGEFTDTTHLVDHAGDVVVAIMGNRKVGESGGKWVELCRTTTVAV